MRGLLAHMEDGDVARATAVDSPARTVAGHRYPASRSVHVDIGGVVVTMSREQAEQLRDALAAALGGEAS